MFNRIILALALVSLPVTAVSAEDTKPPYWAAFKAGVVNMRVGPGEDYRIAWVYHRQFLPMKVLRTMQGWWLIEDPEGARGWVLAQFMSKRRSAMVQGKQLAEMHESADPSSRLLWRLEPGVVAKLGDCSQAWCEVELDGNRRGWVRQDQLWGAGEP